MLSQEQEAALGAAALPGGQLDAATKRAQKIKRFQLEKAVKAELDALKMKVTICLMALMYLLEISKGQSCLEF